MSFAVGAFDAPYCRPEYKESFLVNSLFGLTGQLIKGKGAEMIDAVAGHWPLLVAVLIGGAVGTQLAVKTGPATLIRRLTALLVGFVALRLLFGF